MSLKSSAYRTNKENNKYLLLHVLKFIIYREKQAEYSCKDISKTTTVERQNQNIGKDRTFE